MRRCEPVIARESKPAFCSSSKSCNLYNTAVVQDNRKGAHAMTTEETNKDIVRRGFEGTLTLDEVLAPNFVDHNIGPGYKGGDHREYHKQVSEESARAFSHPQRTINHLIAEGDLVVLHSSTTWTQTGTWRGKAPTGQPVSFCAITI